MEAYDVPCGTISKYIDLLVMWNKKINLVSISDRDELTQRHILDSLQLLDYIDKDNVVFDIGSGAGFPGLMLSYAGVKQVHLIEKNTKKASFLTVAATLSENIINVHNLDVELVKGVDCDVITTRGFASLEEIFESTIHLVSAHTKYVLLKGKNYDNEIKKALDKWNFQYIIHQSKTSKDGFIIEVERLKANEKENYCSS